MWGVDQGYVSYHTWVNTGTMQLVRMIEDDHPGVFDKFKVLHRLGLTFKGTDQDWSTFSRIYQKSKKAKIND